MQRSLVVGDTKKPQPNVTTLALTVAGLIVARKVIKQKYPKAPFLAITAGLFVVRRLFK